VVKTNHLKEEIPLFMGESKKSYLTWHGRRLASSITIKTLISLPNVRDAQIFIMKRQTFMNIIPVSKIPEIKPYNKKQICALINISMYRLNLYIKAFEIGPIAGRYFTPRQVKLIFERVGVRTSSIQCFNRPPGEYDFSLN